MMLNLRAAPADHLLQPHRLLLAAASEGLDDDGQQHHQQLAHGRRLARQISLPGEGRGEAVELQGGKGVTLKLGAVAAALLIAISAGGTASAQKPGGVLKIYHRDSPASMSILEEATNSSEIPMMGVV